MFRSTLRTALLLALVFASAADAQIKSGTVTGIVRDEKAAIIPGAAVVLTDEDTNISSTVRTLESGQFTFPYLPAGTYGISVNREGFAAYKEQGVALSANQTIRVDVTLRLSAVQSTVEVTASSVQIQTDSSTVQTAVSERAIDAIPNVSQNPLYYAMLQAGVAPTTASLDTTSINSFGIGINGRRQFTAVGVNGGRAFTNDVQLDGLPVMGGGYNETSVIPNTEGLSEVRVVSNNFTAEYGHGQSAISMNTKSGTNQFHGQVIYTIRNEALNANTLTNNSQAIKRPPFKVDEIGGSLGGHIIKNKLFFFTSYHYLLHNVGFANLATVPTALQRVGDFSQTLIKDENGNPEAPGIFNPFNVVQINANLYQRLPYPGDVIPNPNPYALKMLSYYPLPNRTPIDFTGASNYMSNTVETVRRHNTTNRLDYHLGKQSFYFSGGLEYAQILNPVAFGTSPFNGSPATTRDKNPYGQIGDTVSLSPTLILDIRYGYNRINTATLAGDKSGFTDYNAFGVPANVQSLMAIYGAAPVVAPGSPWTALSTGNFASKYERQQSHTLNGSVTKNLGKWTLKGGAEFRSLLPNFEDLEEASVEIPSVSNSGTNGNFNFEYETPTGASTSQNTTLATQGYGGASLLTGAGVWWIRPGANVPVAFSQKYLALYTQNDWRVNSRFTLNLGLRWDLQPGPTERYNRFASFDLTQPNAWGSMGIIAFPGTTGYSRNLWNTEWHDIQPRVGGAYQLKNGFVLRGGFGITYLPSNGGYYSGPTAYGSSSFSSGVNMLPYGTNPDGIPQHFYDATPIIIAAGANSAAPSVYGQGAQYFNRNFQNAHAYQWNFFLEKQIARSWVASVGYSASHGANLINNALTFQDIQNVNPSIVASWKAQYIASNGTVNPATQLVPNILQPANGPLIPFYGAQGQATIAQLNNYLPYPLLAGNQEQFTNGFSSYQSMQVHMNRSFSHRFLMDVSYTWSKALDFTASDDVDNQGFNESGTVSSTPDLLNNYNNKKYSFSDIPSRFVANGVYETPMLTNNQVVRSVLGHWSTGVVFISQDGFPISIGSPSTGSVRGLGNRIPGVPVEVPQALQHWYDGKTAVTLSCGRVITPAVRTFLKYNACAFAGQVLTAPNGSIISDQYWFGTAAQDYGDIRTPGHSNIDISLQREFSIKERYKLQLVANAANILNHPELNSAYSGSLGSTVTAPNAATGLQAGMGSSSGYGAVGQGTFAPRQVTLSVRIRF
jgi:trimeric autotransporter adhesin